MSVIPHESDECLQKLFGRGKFSLQTTKSAEHCGYRNTE